MYGFRWLTYRSHELFATPPLSFPDPLGTLDLPLIHPEVMRHLVPHRVLDNRIQFTQRSRHALMRTLVDGDAIRHGESVGKTTTFRERPSLIEAQKAWLGRLPFDYQNDVLHPPPEARIDAGEATLDNAVKLVCGYTRH